MKRVLHQLLCILCALYLSGAHWMILQAAAWTGMIVTRAQQGSIVQAVKSTFDGQHPCQLCSVIADRQQQEQEKEPAAPPVKKADDLKLVAQPDLVVPAAVQTGEVSWSVPVFEGEARWVVPPTPPPLA